MIELNDKNIFTKKELKKLKSYNAKAAFREWLEDNDFLGKEYLLTNYIEQEKRAGNNIREEDLRITQFDDLENETKKKIQIAKENGAEYRKYKEWLRFEEYLKNQDKDLFCIFKEESK